MKHALQPLLIATLFLVASSVAGQGYPSRPIEVIVGYAPGGGSDLSIRLIEAAASKNLGQKIVIINRPGAGGTTALNQFIKMTPDGYTLAIGASGALTLQPHMAPDAVLFTPDDYIPILQISNVPNFLLVPPDSQFKTLADVVEFGKKSASGRLKVGITQPGTTLHLAMVQLEKLYGLKFTYIPHGSSGPIATAVMGGHVDVGAVDFAAAGPQIRAGTVRALGVFAAQRLATLPSVPTFKEQGTDIVAGFFNMLLAPKGTPESVIATLQEVFRKTLNEPDVIENTTKANLPLAYLDSKASRERILRDLKTNGALLGELGLKK